VSAELGDQPSLRDEARYVYSAKGQLVEVDSVNEYRGGKLGDESVYNRMQLEYASEGRLKRATYFNVKPAHGDPNSPESKLDVVQTFEFSYDEAGRVTSTGEESLKYDQLGRLIEREGLVGDLRPVYRYEYDCSQSYGRSATGQPAEEPSIETE